VIVLLMAALALAFGGVIASISALKNLV